MDANQTINQTDFDYLERTVANLPTKQSIEDLKQEMIELSKGGSAKDINAVSKLIDEKLANVKNQISQTNNQTTIQLLETVGSLIREKLDRLQARFESEQKQTLATARASVATMESLAANRNQRCVFRVI